jgi:hypothetical protein
VKKIKRVAVWQKTTDEFRSARFLIHNDATVDSPTSIDNESSVQTAYRRGTGEGAMTHYRCRSLTFSLILLFMVTGCSRPLNKRETGTLIGTGVGAATGAIIGAAVGAPHYGAAIGGGLGATAGALIGDQLQSIANREEQHSQELDAQRQELQRQRRELNRLKRTRQKARTTRRASIERKAPPKQKALTEPELSAEQEPYTEWGQE